MEQKEVMVIKNWSVTGDPYQAPECRTIHLHGYVENHPKLGSATITTSRIVKIVGYRTVETRSGSIYKLGKISKNYRKFLKKIRPEWNWRSPITIYQ